jgi:hypothetical protein
MKSLKFEFDGEWHDIIGYRGATIGRVEKVRVGRRKQWCLVSDDLSWWRPDCLRQVADFIDSLEAAESPATVRRGRPRNKRQPAICTCPVMRVQPDLELATIRFSPTCAVHGNRCKQRASGA